MPPAALFDGLSAAFSASVDAYWKQAFRDNGGTVLPVKSRDRADYFITADAEDRNALELLENDRAALSPAFVSDSVRRRALQPAYAYLLPHPAAGPQPPRPPPVQDRPGEPGAAGEVRHAGSRVTDWDPEAERDWREALLATQASQSQRAEPGQPAASQERHRPPQASAPAGTQPSASPPRREKRRPDWDAFITEPSPAPEPRVVVLEAIEVEAVEQDDPVPEPVPEEEEESPRARRGKQKDKAKGKGKEPAPETGRSPRRSDRRLGGALVFSLEDLAELDDPAFGAGIREFVANVGGDRVRLLD
ncbi:hypothetical protein DFJ74DRAFT_708432 [Hyaloraphidium curvatum]|nr:hypothetical protein DFJ74DRAFT_708432 [Hyaloraphidium curvatum]